jgi:hypothetical protein
MKKILLAIVVCLVVLSGCGTPAERFAADKSRIQVIEGADDLNDAFRNAVEANSDFDEEIADSYVILGHFRGEAYCNFFILTEDGDYLSFDVNDGERLYNIYGPTPPEDKIGGPLGNYELVDWDGHTGTIQIEKNK